MGGDDAYYDDLRRQVEEIFRTRSGAEWVDILNRAGVPVSTVRFPIEMFEDVQAEANEMFYVLDHPTAGRFRVLSPPVSLDDAGFRPPAPTAPFATETRALLDELGFSGDAIEELVAAGVTKIAD